MKELSALAFAATNENVVSLGPPGVGKTHLAVGLAMQALRNGMTLYFATLPQFNVDLSEARLRDD
jgi:DNA replication protein DnaC